MKIYVHFYAYLVCSYSSRMKDSFLGGFEHRLLRRTNAMACVIARQYSSSTIASLCFHSLKEKHRASFKTAILFF